MKKRAVVVLLFTFVLMFSLGNVSAVSDTREIDDEPGFLGKFWNFFKGLFGGERDDNFVDSDDGDLDGEDGFLEEDSDDDEGDGFVGVDDEIQINLYGPTEVGINEPAAYVGVVSGEDSCTINGVVPDDCSSFMQEFTFAVAGTYPITLAAGGEVKTIMLVVGEGTTEFVNETENSSLEPVEEIQILFYGPTEVKVGKTATYRGRVTGTDSCTLQGVPLGDCGSFEEDLEFNVEGTYVITLVAGDESDTITLVVSEALAPEGSGGTPDIVLDAVADVNEVPIDDGTVDSNGWPTYLNVPEYCAGPKENTYYKYYWPLYSSGTGAPAVGPVKLGAPGPVQSHMVKEMNSGNWRMTHMGKNEVYAMPVYSGNSDNWALTTQPGLSVGVMQVSFSECPGDFDRADGAMEVCSVEAVTIGGHWRASTTTEGFGRNCIVEPGKRYFFNLQWNKEWGNCASWDTEVCTSQSSYGTSYKFPSRNDLNIGYPPYTGPCLSTPPFPPNYDRGTCQGHPNRFSPDDGRCGYTTAPGSTRTYTCTDGFGGVVLAEYVYTCIDSEMTVTSGKDIPATPSMVCTISAQAAPKTNFGGCITFGKETIYPLGARNGNFTCVDYKWVHDSGYVQGWP